MKSTRYLVSVPVIITTKEESSIKAGTVARAFRRLLMVELANINPSSSIRVKELKEVSGMRFAFELSSDSRTASTVVKTADELAKKMEIELSFPQKVE